MEDGITPRNPFHTREYTYREFEEILAIYFNDVVVYGQEFTVAYQRLRRVITRLNVESRQRDFALWSNPFMRMGRALQQLRGHVPLYPAEDPALFVAELDDVEITLHAAAEKTTYIARCGQPCTKTDN